MAIKVTMVTRAREDMIDRGPTTHRFIVIYQKQNGEVVHTETDAHDMCDAAWRVARASFDCTHPGDWQLLDVVVLK